MATIEERGPFQFRAKVRRNGISEARTFETKREAQEWARVMEGKVTGDEYQDRTLARGTNLSQACEWLAGVIDNTKSHSKNTRSIMRYWQASEFATWSLVSIRPADLLRWRRIVLDEDAGGEEPECSAQTVIHRLNGLSQVYKRWSLAHDQVLSNPVSSGVRPSMPDGRNRRLSHVVDDNGKDEETRLLEACSGSSRPWLRAAVIIALETCMRQGEIAGLTWNRVRLDVDYPFCDLPQTKNERPRRVPLSERAIAALRSLMPAAAAGVIGPRPVLPVETGRGICHAFRDVVGDEQFPDLRWHDLRHEAISRLFELTDFRDNEIMAISGHLRPEMLTRYTHLRADRLGARLPGGRLNQR